MTDQLQERKKSFVESFALARRLIRVVIGFTVLLLGVIMIVTPGPAVVVIPIGLAILATEFVWARKLLKRLSDGAKSITHKGSS
jgi:tellurite resistance protein TerC